MPDKPSDWVKWTQNGRFASLVWAVTFVVWITFKVLKIPLEGLDTVFLIMSGLLAGNLGISSNRKPTADDSADDKKADDSNA